MIAVSFYAYSAAKRTWLHTQITVCRFYLPYLREHFAIYWKEMWFHHFVLQVASVSFYSESERSRKWYFISQICAGNNKFYILFFPLSFSWCESCPSKSKTTSQPRSVIILSGFLKILVKVFQPNQYPKIPIYNIWHFGTKNITDLNPPHPHSMSLWHYHVTLWHEIAWHHHMMCTTASHVILMVMSEQYTLQHSMTSRYHVT